MNRTILAALVMVVGLGLASCGEKEGPAEKVGKSVDDAVEDTANSVDKGGPAENIGERIDDAVEQAGDAVQKAGEAVGGAMKKAGQQIEEKAGG